VQAAGRVADQNPGGDDDHGQRGRHHPDRLPGDYVGRVAGDRRLGDEMDGPVGGLGEELGDGDDQNGDHDSDQRRVEEVVGVVDAAGGRAGEVPVALHDLDDEEETHDGDHQRNEEAG